MNFNESNQSFRVGFGDSYAIDDFDKLTNRPKYNSNPMTHDTNIPEVKTVAWDAAYTDRHTHSNKSVLDGITGALVSAWNAAYTALHGHSNKAVIDDISAADVSSWNGKYAKPAGGIPSTDMTSAVQTSLGKADTALQSETYTGTVTSVGVSMNGASKGTVTTSGVIDLGTVLTEHQTLSDLGVTASATELNYVDGVTSAIQTQIDGKLATSLKGSANGLAELDATGKVPSSQLPSYVDDVLEYDSMAQFPATGESGKIYVAKDTNKTYRWGGSEYVEISPSLALGETSSTAYRGDRGKTAYDHSQATGNPHNTTLGNLGVTATASELNVLDGITASTTELNYVDGVTSGIQGQLNSASTEIANLQNVTPLASTGDTTDRTTEIQTALNTNGVCRLGTGVFYTTGITLPTNGCLCGSGESTILILASSVASGSAVALTVNSSVTDMTIRGTADGTLDVSSGTIGTRNGILFEGNNRSRSTIHHCFISGFTGGGIKLNNTGSGINTCINASGCYIHNCIVGVYIAMSSEYSRFANVHASFCYYGCINNGGNNAFANCSFSRNVLGLLMDNTDSLEANNSHGSFVGCIFNHSNENNGIAIKAINMTNGEMFDGCSIFYGNIYISGSKGFNFTGCNIGNGATVTILNDSSVTFSNCTMGNSVPSPSISGGSAVYIKNCYKLNGEEFKDGRVNLFDANGTKVDRTAGGITFKWNPYYWICNINGQLTAGSAVTNIWSNASSITPLVPGNKYRIEIERTIPTSDLSLDVWFYLDGTLTRLKTFTKSETFTVPSNATGVMFRVYISDNIVMDNVDIKYALYE